MNEKKIEKARLKDLKETARKEEKQMRKEMQKKTFFGLGKHYDPEDPRIMVMAQMPDGTTRRGINLGNPFVGRVFYFFVLAVIGLGLWLSIRG